MDKLTRDFLWGSTVEKKKLHKVGWNKVTNPKNLGVGGLDIFEMKDRNSAILAKLCWRIGSRFDRPWAQMLISKYLTPSRVRGGARKQPASHIWNACEEGGIIFDNDNFDNPKKLTSLRLTTL